ncbi:ATP-binding protein [Cyanobacteria bacterium FACHB-471]|nr:ATP-binding protein [Cyanobacteria bacterium FACHB-471]
MIPQSAPIKHSVQPSSGLGNVEEAIRELIDRHFFTRTDQYLEIVPWLHERREYKSCGRISGSRGVGKTRALQEYIAMVNGHRGPMRRIKPLRSFYLKSFTSWGTRDVFNRILELLNHGARQGAPKDIRLRTWEMLEDFGLELLILDNAHLVTDKVLFDLVECYRDFKAAIVLVGPNDELDKRLKALDLLNNFRCHRKFQSLSPRQLVSALKGFKKDVLALPETTEFFDGEIINAICEASGGNASKPDEPGCNFTAITEILVLTIAQSSKDGVLRLDKGILRKVLLDYGVAFEPKSEEQNDTEPGVTG